MIQDLDLHQIEANAAAIVDSIGAESVTVFAYLLDEFAEGPVDTNLVFQFVYRSFYRLDNAGLSPEFKSEYFVLMEQSRNDPREISLETLVRKLYDFPGRNKRRGLQFSFVTKLANMINPDYPIYDSEVAKVFRFRPPASSRPLEDRLADYLKFYATMRSTYAEILKNNLLEQPRLTFRHKYTVHEAKIAEVKVLDFIFWSAGKLISRAADGL